MTSEARQPPKRRHAQGQAPQQRGSASAKTPGEGGLRGADRLLALETGRGRRRVVGDHRSGAGADVAAAAGSRRGGRGGGSPGRSRRFLLILGAVGSVVCIVAAIAVGYAYLLYNDVDRVDLGLPPAARGEPQNYLIVGSDTRAGISSDDPNAGAYLGPGAPDAGSARSDTIMILRIDPKQTKAQLLSLPRDLYVPIAGTDHSDRINSAFGRGRAVLTATIQQDFGITINHYVEVDFVGFQKIVDAIGGVPTYFQVPVRDSHTGLNVTSAGCHTLSGAEALQLARSRYLYYFEDGQWKYDGASDISRISRQQTLIRRAIPRAMSKGFRNPVTLKSLADTVVDNITVDKGLGVKNMLSLARTFQHFDAEHLETFSLPTERFFTSSGEDVLRLKEAEAQPTLDVFRGIDPAASARKAFGLRVLNGSGVASQAANVAGALERVGFRIEGMGNSSELGIDQLDHTQIRFAPGDELAAAEVASFLSIDPVMTPIQGAEPGTVELVTGTDFTTVRTQPKAPPSTTTTTAPASTTTTTTTLPVYIPGPPPPGESCG